MVEAQLPAPTVGEVFVMFCYLCMSVRDTVTASVMKLSGLIIGSDNGIMPTP